MIGGAPGPDTRISAEERDALYEGVLDHLSGIGDLPLVIQGGDVALSRRLAGEYLDDLLIVLHDLGFGEDDRESIVLTTPPEVLGRIVRRLQAQGETAEGSEAEEREAAIRAQSQNHSLVETCRRLRSELDGWS